MASVLPLRWKRWPRYERVELVDVSGEAWLLASGRFEETDLLTPREEERKYLKAEFRPLPLYLTFLNTIDPGRLEETALQWAQEHGLLGMFAHDYPHQPPGVDVVMDEAGNAHEVKETRYGQVAAWLTEETGRYVSPAQVEPLDAYHFAYMITVAAVEEKEPQEGYGGLWVMTGPELFIEVRYSSLLDGMLLRIAHDRLTTGLPSARCDFCGAWFVRRHPAGAYCSQECHDRARHRRQAERRREKRRAKRIGGVPTNVPTNGAE